MIRDLDASDARELGPYDLCIVGSGPAGATLAAELAGSALRVAVLESGVEKPAPWSDALRRTECEGIRVKDYSRERVLGGASSTWAGLSSPLDEIDLGERPWLASSGWPIARAELLALYGEAAERYRFPTLAAFGPEGFGALRARGEREPDWRGVDEKVFLAAAEPQHFGKEQRAVFEREDVDVWLDATVVRLAAAGGRVERAHLRTHSGREVTLAARAFVLATGGIENARLLLVSELGNERDQVGRRLMNHPKSYHGLLHLDQPVRELAYFFGCLYHGFAGYAGLRLPESEQREARLLNSYVRLEPLFPWTDSEGVEALVLLAKRSRLLMKGVTETKGDEVVELRDYSETGDDSDFKNKRRNALGWLALAGLVVADLKSVVPYVWHRLRRRAKPAVHRARLRNFMEMEPHPDNRVTLGTQRDAYGVPLPHIAHAPTELDRRSLVALHERLAAEVARTGLGRLESDLATAEPWPIADDASHHMGTTRMGTDPATSVVTPDCRVHSLANLWCAGASVFPTSGCANPTFTLVALSIRLARHLRAHLAAERAP
ncbi:MAG TPA: GMC family oxidoreductase [Planctomycetota bacterium]|nr:GMC family oxidoreductase [Planctomycetota bacterium]